MRNEWALLHLRIALDSKFYCIIHNRCYINNKLGVLLAVVFCITIAKRCVIFVTCVQFYRLTFLKCFQHERVAQSIHKSCHYIIHLYPFKGANTLNVSRNGYIFVDLGDEATFLLHPQIYSHFCLYVTPLFLF